MIVSFVSPWAMAVDTSGRHGDRLREPLDRQRGNLSGYCPVDRRVIDDWTVLCIDLSSLVIASRFGFVWVSTQTGVSEMTCTPPYVGVEMMTLIRAVPGIWPSLRSVLSP